MDSFQIVCSYQGYISMVGFFDHINLRPNTAYYIGGESAGCSTSGKARSGIVNLVENDSFQYGEIVVRLGFRSMENGEWNSMENMEWNRTE